MNSKVMENVPAKATPWALLSMRWTARIIGLALGALVIFFIIGEGGFPVLRTPREWLMTAFFLISTIALILGCRWEALGGILSVAGMGGFYQVHYWFSGFSRWPGGWVIPSFFIPGLLYILCAILEHRKNHSRPVDI